MWSSDRIRKTFIDFFKSKMHQFVPAVSIVPEHDPSLLFVNAGMNQFKDVFLGKSQRPYTRAVNSQFCVRVSGKHNDLEDVGHDGTHLTSFEMLGNWSFGDYYKKEAIVWAWDLFTTVFGIDKNRLYVTVYVDDQESFDIWKSHTDVLETHVIRCDAVDNFWEMGTTGPCGPCSELHVDLAPNSGVPRDGFSQSDIDSDRFLELWNLVFIQYNRRSDGTLDLLPKMHVDTGSGLERLAAFLQDASSNYTTDIFIPIIRNIEMLSKVPYSDDDRGIPHRVIADHMRTICIGITDRVIPSNEGRGYVLRRLLRRAMRYVSYLQDSAHPFLYLLVPTVVKSLRDVYPSILESQCLIEKIIKSEEDSFLKTLTTGLSRVDDLTERMRQRNQVQLSGEDAFKLYDTYGFPIDLTQSLLKEKGLEIDMDGYNKCLDIQKEQSRTTPKSECLEHVHNEVEINNANFSSLPLLLSIYTDRARGGEARLISDPIEKMDMARHHSATHLLHSALRTVLGPHVSQAGSLVDSDRLRFDFVHFEPIGQTDLKKIEEWVNRQISQDLHISCKNKTLDQAKQMGAMALFGEKYESDSVRVVKIGPVSIELCGGTHVNKTSLIESFKIISETAISSGTRRIEAIAGRKWVSKYGAEIREKRYNQILQADAFCRELEQTIIADHGDLPDDILSARPLKAVGTVSEITQILDSSTDMDLLEIIEQYVSYRKFLEKRQSQRDTNLVRTCMETLMSHIEPIQVSELSILAMDLPQCNMKVLKMLSDDLVCRYSRLIILIGGRSDDKGVFVIRYPNELIPDIGPAKKIMNDIVRCCGGNGGGRDSFIAGGGADSQRLSEALVMAKTNIINRLNPT